MRVSAINTYLRDDGGGPDVHEVRAELRVAREEVEGGGAAPAGVGWESDSVSIWVMGHGRKRGCVFS